MEVARSKHELLSAAQEAGLKITPELASEIDGLAATYARSAAEAAKLDEAQGQIRQRAEEMRDFNKDLARGIVDGFVNGAKAADVFADSLKKVGNRLLDMAFDGLFGSSGSGSSGGGFNLLSLFGLPGRADGGPVGRVTFTHKPEVFS